MTDVRFVFVCWYILFFSIGPNSNNKRATRTFPSGMKYFRIARFSRFFVASY